MYIERIAKPGWLTDDEMGVARDVILSIYQFANRDVPTYFPSQPLEELYDSDLRAWQDLIHQRKAKVHRSGRETTITFTSDLQPQEMQEYRACLPQTVKTRKIGNRLVVENPADFHRWLDGASTESGLRKLFKRSR